MIKNIFRNITANGWFCLALVIGSVLLFTKLDKYPAGFYIDEASVGFCARSLLLTGRDEWGKVFPLFLKYYGVYNPPIYTYLTIIPIFLFGATVTAVRITSALFGFVGIIGIYWLVKTLRITKGNTLPGLAALVFATSPWLMLYARTGYEINPAMVFLLFAMVFAYKALTKPKYLYLTILFLSLSTYTAYAERLLAPFIVIVYLLFFGKKILVRKNKELLIRVVVFGLVLQLPHFWLLTTPAFLPKESELSDSHKVTLGAMIWEYASQYVNYFSPNSLFFRSDPDLQRSIPELAVFYPWLVVPYLVGIWQLWKRKTESWAKLVFVMLIASPIPASLTRDPFASHRIYHLIIPLVIILSLGLERLIVIFGKKISYPTILVLVASSLVMLGRSYFVLMPYYRDDAWMAGYQQLAREIKARPEETFVVDQGRLKPSYANLGYLLPIDIRAFQAQFNTSVQENYYRNLNPSLSFELEKLKMRMIDWKRDPIVDQIIVGDTYSVSDSQAAEHFLTREFEIKNNQGEIVLVGWKTHPELKCREKTNAPSSVYCP